MDYALISPVRNEADNLPRLAEAVTRQSVLPRVWVIVDNGSTDATPALAVDLAAAHPWIRVLEIPGEVIPTRGGPIVRALARGLTEIEELPEVVVKLDADVTFEHDHFERMLGAFEQDQTLGMASSTCWEQDAAGAWRPQFTTRSHVRGAVRAYRRACLQDVLPLEQRIGWDGIDELKAAVSGWRTATLPDVRFYHHRGLGERDRSLAKWAEQGAMGHYLGYRPSYLALRAIYRALRDPAALAMIWGYAGAALSRAQRYPDPRVREYLRREQALRRLPCRVREAVGRSATRP